MPDPDPSPRCSFDASKWRVGTIGFAYDDWADVFFPPGLRPSQRLNYYATQFGVIELDTTFYATPTLERLETWRGQTPEDFRFIVKAPQAITHGDALLDEPETLAAWTEFVKLMREGLGDRLKAILVQFPPRFDARHRFALADFLKAGEGVGLAVEFRHESWQTDEAALLLSDAGAVWVNADLAPAGHAWHSPDEPQARKGYRPFPYREVGPWRYLRFCGRHGQYASDSRELGDVTPRVEWWLRHCVDAQMETVAVFGNSFAGYAPASCGRLMKLLGMAPRQPAQPGLFDDA